MAKKKKNLRNINTGDTVQFVNYLTPDHILRGKYNTGNNELDITDVPQNLNSIITLGQGGGGGLDNPTLTMNIVFENAKKGGQKIGTPKTLSYLTIENNTIKHYRDDIIDQSRTIEALIPYGYDLDNNPGYFQYTDQMQNFSASDLVNCTVSEYLEYIQITDPTQDASITITYTD